MSIFILIKPSPVGYFEYDAIQSSLYPIKINEESSISFKNRLSVFVKTINEHYLDFVKSLQRDLCLPYYSCPNNAVCTDKACKWMEAFKNRIDFYDRVPIQSYFLIEPNKFEIKFVCTYCGYTRRPIFKVILVNLLPLSFKYLTKYLIQNYQAPLKFGYLTIKRNVLSFNKLIPILGNKTFYMYNDNFRMNEYFENT